MQFLCSPPSFVVPEAHSTAHVIPPRRLSRWEQQLRVHDPLRPLLAVVPPVLESLTQQHCHTIIWIAA
ncbi:hypothetical protein B0H11DRAFT_2289724 [Mycena galericulata]|nr:hypothetical protein B0H11DRAFT_2289724 [Mycena galericulata]